ncbi:cadherin-like domain-containing protein, partial [Gammaproteobacteria bacterium]|nr:cadherin-like domain-containing protein [Gammaproteobacteria bacterium]
ILPALLIISSCGGGGGGGGAPTLTISSSSSEALVGSSATLTWTSSSTSCSAVASGAWSGAKTPSGSEQVTITATGTNTYSLTCGAASGSASVTGFRNSEGIVADGYLSDATIFIDSNGNYQVDGSETSATSNSSGAFTIKHSNGSFVSLGGTDVDTQTLLTDLVLVAPNSGYIEAPVVSPVTTLAAFMDNPDDIYTALGIDSSLDIFTTDPVANKNLGNNYAILYEKGNQLTVLALALTNLTNNLNSGTDNTTDYFEGIASVIETAFAANNLKVEIESRDFISSVMEGLIVAKSLTISDASKTNTIDALSAILPLIQVKSSNAVERSILNFSLKTLQTDIVTIANGSASASLISSYTSDIKNYITTKESVTVAELSPLVFAFDDTVATDEDTAIAIDVGANDSLVPGVTATIGIVTAPVNGTLTISGTTVTYTPSANFNGSDSFTYSVTQDSETATAVVTISVGPINDAPTIDSPLSLRAVSGATAVADLSISDVDGDALTLSLEGTDAASFSISSDGVLTFKTAPDFFAKSTYSVTVVASDGTLTTSQVITVNVFRAQTAGFEVPDTIAVIETL